MEKVIYKIHIKSKSESHLTNQNKIFIKHCLLLSNKTVVWVYTVVLLDAFRLFGNTNWAWDNLKWKRSHLNWIVYFQWDTGIWCLKTPHKIPSMQKRPSHNKWIGLNAPTHTSNLRSSTGARLVQPSPFLPRELVFHSLMTSTSSLSESSDPFFLPFPFFFFL